jgi:hypothetical protein
MADLTEVYAALQKADAAGDTEGAKKLADYIRSQSATPEAVTAPSTKNSVPPVTTSEGMPAPRSAFEAILRHTSPAYMAVNNQFAPDYLSQAAAAAGRGLLKNWGTLGGLGDIVNKPSATPGAPPEGAGFPATSQEVEQAAGLQKTPEGYGQYEFLGGLLGPGIISQGLGLAARGGRAGVEFLNNLRNVKNATYVNAAEGRGPEIINALRSADNTIVPGSLPTAGQAAVDVSGTQFPSLQKAAEKVLPTQYLERADVQKAARLAQLREVGGTPEELRAAETARANAAEPLYTEARAQPGPVNTQPVLDVINKAITENPGNTALVREMSRIKSNMGDMANSGDLASVLDDVKAALKSEDNKFITGALTNVKDKLVEVLPGMEKAQATFREMSKPVNTMEIGQYLEGKLTPALGETVGQRAGPFAEALRSAPTTIKRATGTPRFDSLAQILAPEDMAKLEGIRADLARTAEYETKANAGTLGLPVTEAKLPNFMNRIASIANEVIKKLAGKIDRKTAIEIATEMLDPATAANAMEKALANEAAQAARKTATTTGAAANTKVINQLAPAGATINALAEQRR